MLSIKKLKVVDIKNTDPYLNLAIEELLFDECEPGELIVFLWQNENTVVLGQNQSVYSQIDVRYAKKNEIKIARRKSGGGAVYHDLGNLNYSFISNYSDLFCHDNYNVIMECLYKLGLFAVFEGRNDIIIENKKVSGNAYYRNDKMICHHGTILVNTDFDKMYKVLNIEDRKWQDKGIDSVRARTSNLVEFRDSLTVDIVREALMNTVYSVYAGVPSRYIDSISNIMFNDVLLQSKIYEYESNKWIFEKAIDESVKILGKFDWGSISVNICLKNNIISDITIFSDMMEAQIIPLIVKEIKNTYFSYESIEAVFLNIKLMCGTDNETIVDDIFKIILAETCI